MHLEEKHISTEEIFDGKILKVQRDTVLLEDGTTATREMIRHPGGVGILPLDDDNNVYVVRQFRYPHSRVMLEIPAGKMEWGENPLETAKRELKEEIGADATEYINLYPLIPTPAYCCEVTHLYLAKGLRFSSQKLDDGEFLDVEKIPLQKLVDMVMSGEITDGKTQAAILKVNLLVNG